MCQALLEIMEPEINKIKADLREKVTKEVTEEVTREVTEEVTREVTKEVTKQVTREVTREGIRNTVMALRENGQTEEVIKQIISKAYHISIQEAESYDADLWNN